MHCCFDGGPYLGLLTYVFLPLVFVVGLALIPLGAWRHRKLEARARVTHEALRPPLPIIDLNNDRTRGIVLASVFIGLLSTVVLAGATYKAVHVMETVAFSARLPHRDGARTPLPALVAHQAHCADCHLGEGADVRQSKISGSALISVALTLSDADPKPVQATPARETCEAVPLADAPRATSSTSASTSPTTRQQRNQDRDVDEGGGRRCKSSGHPLARRPRRAIRYRAPRSADVVDSMPTPDGIPNLQDRSQPEGKPSAHDGLRRLPNRPAHTFQPLTGFDSALAASHRHRLPFIKREAMRS